MAMIYGDKPSAGNSEVVGMTKSVYDAMYPDLVEPGILTIQNSAMSEADKATAIEAILKYMKIMAWTIAKGVIDHIVSNMEINGIQTTLTSTAVTTTGTGTGTANYVDGTLVAELPEISSTPFGPTNLTISEETGVMANVDVNVATVGNVTNGVGLQTNGGTGLVS